MSKWILDGIDRFPLILRLDFFVGCEHHGKLRNSINKNEVNIFSGCSDLYLYMGNRSSIRDNRSD